MSPQQILISVTTGIVNKSTDNIKTTFDLFFTAISMSKKMFFFSERELKKALRNTFRRAALSGLL